MKLIRRTPKQNGNVYYGAFAQHDATGGSQRWDPEHASPGIDSTTVNRGPHRSMAGVVLPPVAGVRATRGVVTLRTISGHYAVKEVI